MLGLQGPHPNPSSSSVTRSRGASSLCTQLGAGTASPGWDHLLCVLPAPGGSMSEKPPEANDSLSALSESR